MFSNKNPKIDFEKDVLKSEPNLEIKRVDQSYYLNKISRRKGICAGISTVNILAQLSSNQGAMVNPFDSEDLLNKSLEIQNSGDMFDWKRTLEKELPLENKPLKQSFNFDENNNDKFIEQFNDKLKSKVAKTLEDKKGRGVLISTQVHQNPSNQQKMNGRHAVSMTAKIYQDNIYCTGVDPNFFFAHAKGETGCNKLADLMSNTLKAYGSDYYGSYNAKMKK